MYKKQLLPTLIMAAYVGVAPAAIITVNTADNTDFSAGKTNLVRAIEALQNGDTIQFNISGSGVHYIQTPPDGYPLITKHNVTIDGYSQPGASANTNSIHATNNAVLKICLTSTNGNALSMGIAVATFTGLTYNNLGFGSDELAILGTFRATNVWIKGLAILSAPEGVGHGQNGTIKSLAFCADSLQVGGENAGYWHVSGCWFGVDPTTRQVAFLPDNVTIATPGIAIASYRTRNDDGSNVRFPQPATLGVAAGSANPRAEFNVFFTGYGFDCEGLNYRVAGNFFNVLPDGVTNPDISVISPSQVGDAYIEIGRSYDNCTIGTDGDGVNDAEEGNVFGGCDFGSFTMINLYGSSAGTNFVISGNWFGIGIDGSRFTNSAFLVNEFNANAQVQFGSDFNGVSDALEGNRLYGFTNDLHDVFDGSGGSLNVGIRMSFRGNSTVNDETLPYSYANGTALRLTAFTNYSGSFMSTNAAIIPELSPSSTTADIIGNCASTNGGSYSNIFIDVYVLDTEAWSNGIAQALFELNQTNGIPLGKTYLGTFVDNGPDDRDPAVASYNFGSGALGIAPGTLITVTANYSADPAGTTRGRTHTSNFSNPVTLRPPLQITSVSRSGSTLTINWSGGTGPYTLQRRSPLTGAWSNVTTGIAGTSTTASITGTEGYFRVLGN